MKGLAIVILWIGISTRLFSQSGPAGVGTSTHNVLWLKANAGTSTTTDGAAISSWNDQSGNGVNVSQSTAAQRPTYKSSLMNGMPAIEFDNSTTAGQNDYLTAPDNAILDNTAGYTTFSVLRMKNLNGEARCIVSKRTSIDTDEAFMFFFYSSNYLHLDIDGLGNRFNGTNAYAVNTNYLVGFGFDGSLTSTSRSKLTEGDSTRKISTESSSTVPDKSSPLVIGATHASDDRPFSGYISELILYRTALAVAPQTIIYNYLSAKYDIALLKNDKYAGDNAANGNYDFDVAGIGKEVSGSNTDFDASVSRGLKITANSGLDNGDYLLVGNKAPANWENRIDVGGMTGTNNARWERIWYVDVTNTSTAIAADIEFDFSDAGISGGPGTASNYVLLYRAGLSG
ncbi:MAG TPA: LamG-like jellyroll fold domain-containing protein, partial [Bacteroidia bacterium]